MFRGQIWAFMVRPNWLRNRSAWTELIIGCSMGTPWQKRNNTPFHIGRKRFQRSSSHVVLSTSSVFVYAGWTKSEIWSFSLVRDEFVFMFHLNERNSISGSRYRCGQEPWVWDLKTGAGNSQKSSTNSSSPVLYMHILSSKHLICSSSSQDVMPDCQQRLFSHEI